MLAPSDERGQASVTYLLAIVISLIVFVLMANLLMFLYARAVIRAAVDEGARAGSMANGSEVECLARATDARSTTSWRARWVTELPCHVLPPEPRSSPRQT